MFIVKTATTIIMRIIGPGGLQYTWSHVPQDTSSVQGGPGCAAANFHVAQARVEDIQVIFYLGYILSPQNIVRS